MARRPAAIALVLSLSAVGMAGCATTAGVHREYLTAQKAPTIIGSTVITVDRSQSFKGGPQSLTGAAWTLTEPLGEIMATTAETVLAAGFSGGASVNTAPRADAYSVGLTVKDFSYKYDQLSNLGFAVTPKISVTVEADVAAPGGKPELHKAYSRKDFSAGSYIISVDPPEKVNRALHLALAEICKDLLADVAALKVSVGGPRPLMDGLNVRAGSTEPGPFPPGARGAVFLN